MNELTKPLGALGNLEEIVIRLAGMTGNVMPDIGRKTMVVFCGDHGVTEEGVSAYPSDVTGLMIHNFCKGGAAVNVLSRRAGADVKVVDVGSRLKKLPACVVDRKVRLGTANMAVGPAMEREEAEEAIAIGITIAQELKTEGVQLAGVGEMGIGNTTATSAVASALTGMSVDKLVGRGTGIDDVMLRQKVKVIRKSLAVNQPNKADAIDVLAKVGGLELAAMTGFVLGAASVRLPVVIDGVISTVAAFVAMALSSDVKKYLFASHLSVEPAHRILLDQLGLEPLIDAKMRLGEGSGAVLSFPLFDSAVAVAREMATFADLGL
ncbi:nicotinate-nucleotide--dimethylbenzimidazole phosphoribosyltransferase [Marininema halotolerans]|uniref:Nicotinate-nucleotide--dimethylbenzimidazole phosphoribosyltransferase n=2 Tax=Marininema halotolerans TaxID=1155944 RepID=A0A1I6RHI2_9BACL|nr:nicotinate-nucleotide--dimethylbenzimidazole phosphoribosyltransferase [Marininema halotolerans]